MEDRLVQIIKEKHLVTWKERDNLHGVAAAEIKLVFQRDDDITIVSELEECYLHDQPISEYLSSYDKGEGFLPYGDSVTFEAYFQFLKDMQEINGDSVHGTFKDVIHALAHSGVNVDKELRRELEYFYEEIGKILNK